MNRLILASASPRRAALLAEANIPFAIEPADVDERFDPALSLRENARAVALRKARAMAARHPGAFVLGADTIVALDGEAIGKPRDEADAVRMILKLAGRAHEVVTGVASTGGPGAGEWTGDEVTRVRFGPVTQSEAEAYAATGEPLDKAGAYAIQGGAGQWIEGYEGSYSNIVGLPMELTLRALAALGFTAREGPGVCR
ncbi:MAG: septum formation protein Maf [Nitrospinae bacterium]|nr:septum formation protein Maf [Nitrospinota bacterium]